MLRATSWFGAVTGYCEQACAVPSVCLLWFLRECGGGGSHGGRVVHMFRSAGSFPGQLKCWDVTVVLSDCRLPAQIPLQAHVVWPSSQMTACEFPIVPPISFTPQALLSPNSLLPASAGACSDPLTGALCD